MKNNIRIIGFILFCLSALIIAGLFIYIFFADYNTMMKFGYIFEIWNKYPIYRYCIIAAIIGYCMLYFTSKK